ncbi:MAG TPA: LysE family transporter [Mycobacteriales bacterium]|nr:LysE family transporter [Mycobacteriales bacterium]
MRYLPQLAVLGAVWFVVVLAPGPNFLAAVAAATTGDRQRGVRTALGFALGDAIWATSSLLGLAVLLARYDWLADVVRFGGATLLVTLGLRSVLRARRDGAGQPAAATGQRPGPARSRLRSPLLIGLLVDLGNPKAAVFFTSLFAALLPAGVPVWVAVVAVAEMGLIPAAWYSVVACLFSTGRVRRAYQAMRRPIDAVVGAVFVALGIRLATSS